MKPIYLDYNATTPIDSEVATVMQAYIDQLFGNPSSSYAIGLAAKEAVAKARQEVAALLNCHADEIVFTSGGTESNNMAIKGIALANKDKGKHIISSAIEHPAVVEVCRYLATLGYEITYVPVDAVGRVSPKDVEQAIRPDTILISIMHANNETGTIQDIADIGQIAQQKGIAFHTDAAQSVGKIDCNVATLGVDLLTIAAHKLYAPKGIGALYIKRGVKLENIIHGAGQEQGIRPGTENVMHIAALGQACTVAKRDLDKNASHMLEMKMRLYNGLKTVLGDQLKLNGSLEGSLPNTLSLAFEQMPAYQLAASVSQDLYISTGSACHSDAKEASAVLKAMGIDVHRASHTVRMSTGKYTNAAEVDRAIQLIVEAVS